MKLFGTKWASPWRTTKQLLHRVREDVVQLVHGDVPASLLGMRGGEAALTVQDAAAAPVRDELPDVRMIRDVGSVVVSEPAVSDPPLGVGGRDAALVVQDGAVHLDPARDEVPRYVGSTIMNEPSFNSVTMAQN